MIEITGDAIVPFLLNTLPELQQGYEEELTHSRGGSVTPYTFAMMVLNPMLHDLLARGAGEDTLRRAFAAVEALARHPTEEVFTFATAGILEDFALSGPELADRARRYMGPESRSYIDNTRAWHRAFAEQQREHRDRARTARTRSGRGD